MRIRKRLPHPPPQNQPNPTPEIQTKRPENGLHHQEQEGDLSRNLHGWWRRSSPILSQVLQEESKDHKYSDKLWIDTRKADSSERLGVDSIEAMEVEQRPMGKAEAGAIIDGKKRRRPAVMVEGSRCSRVNGRGWRCSQYTLVGYSLCEHHLGKGRLRSMSSVRAGGATKQPIKDNAIEDDGDEIMEGAKARSMSSLINQPSSLISTANACSS